MKIGIPVGGFHQGNTAEYVVRALKNLGHASAIINQEEFEAAAQAGSFAAYICVDSGEPLRLEAIPQDVLAHVAFWYIDYRHNKNRPTRVPPDAANARLLSDAGGWVFQAQYQDVEDCAATGIPRASWLPMAADPEIWRPGAPGEKQFDVSFVGNIWDEGRLHAVRSVQEGGFRFAAVCNGAVWKEKAAQIIWASKVGFNISSWYGTEFAFDLNMRFFEVLSCGVPIVTNSVPALSRIFPSLPGFIRTYERPEEIVPVLRTALGDQVFLESGGAAREWIQSAGTYEHRMREALGVMKAKLNVG